MPELFDKLEIPDFTDMLPSEAWAACEAWEDWAYEEAYDFSDDQWDEVVGIMRANYDRYYEQFGG